MAEATLKKIPDPVEVLESQPADIHEAWQPSLANTIRRKSLGIVAHSPGTRIGTPKGMFASVPWERTPWSPQRHPLAHVRAGWQHTAEYAGPMAGAAQHDWHEG